ncbi:MAG TPA: response regulator transcription factor [Bacillota bacterium]|nr:response regulator transcription factor [Bacillota bacterium]
MRRVLIIEDEKNVARFIELELKYEGFEATVSMDGREGLEFALNEEWDMILLDLMLPTLNGIEICRRVRAVKNTPIIMLTARDSVIDKISGLDSGADDYISKPFAIEELLARIRTILRRVENVQSKIETLTLTYDDLQLIPDARIVKRQDDTIDLTRKEFDLLHSFMKNINRVLTRDMILELVWGHENDVEANIVDVYVSYLRNKLDSNNKEHYIETVRGTGYVMRK